MDDQLIYNSPIISVVMPVYNGDKYLNEAIDSILNQSFTDFEFIIINDGSKDGSLSIIKSYNDKRIILIDNTVNKGLIYSLNKGVELSNGKYIARMDQDDVSLPNRFKRQLEFLELNINTGVCSCNYIQFTKKKESYNDAFINHDDILGYMLFNSSIIHPSLMIRSPLLKSKAQPFDSNYKHAEDYELWSRLIFETKFSAVSELLFKYRLHESQVTEIHKQAQIKSANLIRKNILQKNGFIFSEDELSIHNKIGSSELLKNFSDLVKAEKWLSNLKFQNEKQNFITKSNFNYIIGKQWFDVCGNTNLGLKAFFYFFKSDLKNQFSAYYTKLFVKCTIRRFKK